MRGIFEIGQKNNLGIPRTVMYNGIFEKTVPEFSGIHVFKADKPIIEKLEESNNLIALFDSSIKILQNALYDK